MTTSILSVNKEIMKSVFINNPHSQKRLFFVVSLLLILSPSPTMAAAQPTTFKDLVSIIIAGVLNPMVPLLFGAALVFFLWGVTTYILHGAEEAKRQEGRQMMIYGIVGLFVMLSVWGLVNVLAGTFGFSVIIPQLPT